MTKGILRWLNNVQNLNQMIDNRNTYENVIEMTKIIGKEVKMDTLHLLRTLSHYCSENYFSLFLEQKIKSKIMNKKPLFTDEILYLR